MKEWFHLATRPSIMKRALKYAVIVGSVLITINHGHAIYRHEVTHERLLQMALTVCVPFTVSTLSSVGALLHHRKVQNAE